MNVNVFQYNLLYSLYSWPNVILSLIGGVLIDRILGIRWGTIIFSAFVCLGQVIASYILLIEYDDDIVIFKHVHVDSI